MRRLRSSQTVAVLASGGIDSSVLIGQLLDAGARVQPIYIRCGLYWEHAELRGLRRFLRALAHPALAGLVVLDLPMARIYGAHWSITGRGVPDAASPDEAVELPGRNRLLFVKAALWCHGRGIDQLALGTLAANPFADATEGFVRELEAALNRGLRARLKLLTPLAQLTKREVIQRGASYPLHLTFSCIAPVDDRHCGKCNKCAERRAALLLSTSRS